MNRRAMKWWWSLLAAVPMMAMAQQAHRHMAMPAMPTSVATPATYAVNAGPHTLADTQSSMHMQDDAAFGKVMFDQLEWFHDRSGDGGQWDAQAWYGNDSDKVWLRSQGARQDGQWDDADLEVLWDHAVSAFWDRQLGVRQDVGSGPTRTWLAFGVQGLAPYWFDVSATGYVGAAGRLAARVRISYEWLFTQRLMLEPEFEADLYSHDDSARGIRKGLSDMRFGLRLRYAIRRRLAPYVGVVWQHRPGHVAGFPRIEVPRGTDVEWVIGVRWWL